jgi:hypothetical protein
MLPLRYAAAHAFHYARAFHYAHAFHYISLHFITFHFITCNVCIYTPYSPASFGPLRQKYWYCSEIAGLPMFGRGYETFAPSSKVSEYRVVDAF